MIEYGRAIVAIAVAAAGISTSSRMSAQAAVGTAAVRLDGAIVSGEFKQITSVAVVQHGKPIFERYYGSATATTIHNTRSATKTVVGALVGAAIERGYVKDVGADILPFLVDRQPLAHPDPRK